MKLKYQRVFALKSYDAIVFSLFKTLKLLKERCKVVNIIFCCHKKCLQEYYIFSKL